MIRKIGGQWPDEFAFFPIIAEGGAVALLYCDNLTTEEKAAETEGLEIFIDQAGLALEKSLLQRKLQEMEKKTKS
jgi:GAF domain-containing protein